MIDFIEVDIFRYYGQIKEKQWVEQGTYARRWGNSARRVVNLWKER